MLKIAICDDNEEMLKEIENIIMDSVSQKLEECEIIRLGSGAELADYCKRIKTDCIVADIDMPGMNGFEAVREVQKIYPDIPVIFVTAHTEYAIQAYDYQPFWFVRKTHLNDLYRVMERFFIKKAIEREKISGLMQLKIKNEVTEINVNTVRFVSSYKHYIIIHDTDMGDVRLRCSIAEIEKQLDALHFVRVQRGIIVNCRFIKKITSRDVILSDDSVVHISRDRLDNVRNAFQDFWRYR
ncbi:MAG: LytTR family DNA-binding domain-containing protein [Clostridiales bacterium]|nr:LytTR family DNA-binding domain-containing protein [Clostridiales bacterium]